MLLPVYGFLEGDVMGLLVLVHDHHKLDDFANQLTQAAAVRVLPFLARSIHHDGQVLDPQLTLAQAGIKALDRIDVRRLTHEEGTRDV